MFRLGCRCFRFDTQSYSDFLHCRAQNTQETPGGNGLAKGGNTTVPKSLILSTGENRSQHHEVSAGRRCALSVCEGNYAGPQVINPVGGGGL